MSKQLEEFKEAVSKNSALQEQIKNASLQQMVVIANAMGYAITAEDIEDQIKTKGTAGAVGAVIVWENYFIVG